MRRLLLLGVLILLGVTSVTAAQETALKTRLETLTPELDVYGSLLLSSRGILVNEGPVAYTDITLMATGYDAAGTVVAEGFGFLVNACRAALLPDFVLEPGSEQPYSIPLELYEDGVQIDRVEVTASGTQTIPAAVTEAAVLPKGISALTAGEVVNVEWIDGDNLRYAEGCHRDLFVFQTWQEYNLLSEESTPIEHPKAALVTDALRTQLGLTDPLYFQHSALTYDPTGGRRLVYQTELNTMLTAEPDGSFKRLLFDRLSSYSLEGIQWLRDGRFLAYYYGATGRNPVQYFTATAEGRVLSESVPNSIPSHIVPGATPDGERLVIALDDDAGTTGYYLKRSAYPGTELLFEHPAPGNNWPAPAWVVDPEGPDRVYLALPDAEGAPYLACYNTESQTLNDLTPLPFMLGYEDRAWWWMSPDDRHLALAANGLNGGLWLLDLAALGVCS